MPAFNNDLTRAAFLEHLDEACELIEVSDWEAKFIDSNLDRKHFTEPQRKVIDDMMGRYADQLQ